MEMAFLSNKEIFEGDYHYFTEELSWISFFTNLLRKFEIPPLKDEKKKLRILVHSVDSIVHRQILQNSITSNDEELVEFLLNLVVNIS